MADSSLSKRQRLIALAAAAALVALSWLYFDGLWRGVVVSGAGDSNAVGGLIMWHRRQLDDFFSSIQ